MSQKQSKQMVDGGGLAENDNSTTTIPTTMHDSSAPPRLPDELMLMIYDFCPRSTLTKCLVLDHRQFDLVVQSLWRIVRSPSDLNLNHITSLLHGDTDPIRRSAYLSAIRTYRVLSWPSARKRFEPVDELPYIAEHCPNIRRLDCSYSTCDLTFWRGSAGTWTEVELYVDDIAEFMEYERYADSFSETVFTAELPDLTLTRLAINMKQPRGIWSEQEHDSCLESFVDWVLPELDGLRTLEIGPSLGKIPQMVRLFTPTIDKLWLYGDLLGDEAIRVIVEQLTVLPGLRDFAFCPSWSGYLGGTSPELRKALGSLSLQTITYIMQPSQMNPLNHNEAFWDVFDSTVPVRFVHEYDTLFYKKPWVQEEHPVLDWERKLLKEMENLAREAGQAERGLLKPNTS